MKVEDGVKAVPLKLNRVFFGLLFNGFRKKLKDIYTLRYISEIFRDT